MAQKYSTTYTFKLADQASGPLKGIVSQIKGVEQGTAHAATAMQQLGQGGAADVNALGKALTAAERDMRKLIARGAPDEAIAESRQEVDRLAAALKEAGGTRSLGQLQNQARSLKRALAGAFDPQQQQRLQSELKQTEEDIRAIKQQASGADEELSGMAKAMQSIREGAAEGAGGLNVGGFNLAALANPTTAAAAGVAGLTGGIGAMIVQTGRAGQKINELSAQMERFYPDAAKADIDQAAQDITGLARVTGTTENEISRAANTLTKEFGGSLQENIGLLRDTFLSLGDEARFEEMLDQVREYSTQLRAAGVDQEGLLSLLVQSENRGVYSDKGVDAVKEFGLRIREQTKPVQDALRGAFGEAFTNELLGGINAGTTTTLQALQMVSERMRTFEGDTSKVQTVMADVFAGAGEDAGRPFLESLGQMQLTMDGLVDSSNELTKRRQDELAAQKELTAAQQEFGEVWGKVSPQIDLAFTKMKTFFAEGLNFLIEFNAGMTEMLGGFDKMVQRFSTGGISGVIGGAIGDLFSDDDQNGGGRVTEEDGQFIQQMINPLGGIMQAAQQATGATGGGASGAGTTGAGTGSSGSTTASTTVGVEARRPTTVNIYLEKFQDEINIYSQTMEQGGDEAADTLARQLTAVLNESGETS